MKKANRESPVLIQFTAKWCKKCDVLKKEVASKFDDTMQWIVIDVDDVYDLQERFAVHKLPRFDVYFGGKTTTLESFDASMEALEPLMSVEERPPLVLDASF